MSRLVSFPEPERELGVQVECLWNPYTVFSLLSCCQHFPLSLVSPTVLVLHSHHIRANSLLSKRTATRQIKQCLMCMGEEPSSSPQVGMRTRTHTLSSCIVAILIISPARVVTLQGV